jgi:hypothetical protein
MDLTGPFPRAETGPLRLAETGPFPRVHQDSDRAAGFEDSQEPAADDYPFRESAGYCAGDFAYGDQAREFAGYGAGDFAYGDQVREFAGYDATGEFSCLEETHEFAGDGETRWFAVQDETREFPGYHRPPEFDRYGGTGKPSRHARHCAETVIEGHPSRMRPQPQRYAARHAAPRWTARKRASVVAPVAVIAATLAAGIAAYGFTGNDSPQATPLSSAIAMPGSLSGVLRTGAGKADTAASAMITARQHGSTAAHAATRSTTTALASSASATPSAATTSASATNHSNGSAKTGSAARTPTATPSTSPSATATTFSCNLSNGLLPENVTAIVNFLIANGYSHNAVAGMAGNIYQESKGDPEAVGMGGGGLIGWTPLPSGMVTGNPAADLQTQLAAILTYNQIWASYIPALNAAATPADAAYIYVTDFERAGIPAASTREASAQDVATACGL